MRIVSLCPSNTEVVGYIGKEDVLVAVDDYSDWPPRISGLPRVGPDLSIDMDKVEALKPDLVLASLSVPGMERNIEELERRNIPHIILNPQSLADIAQDIETVGKVLNDEELGKAKARQFREKIKSYQAMAESNDKKKLSLYWEWWPKPVFTPGGTNWLTEVSELAGGINIFKSEQTANYQTDWEEVKKRNPDHICMVWVGVKEEKMRPELLKKRPGWDQMKAIQNDHIHILEEALFCRPSPRLLQGVEKLKKLLFRLPPQ